MPSMTAAPPLVVGAARTPTQYGLFSVLDPRPEGDGKWQNGVRWEAESCDPIGGIGAPWCDPDDVIGLPKQFGSSNVEGEASPFTVYGDYLCTPIGNTLAYAQEQADARLRNREEHRVEQAIWTGDLGNTPNLATGATVLKATATPVVEALSRLEWSASNAYGSQGVIHMTRGMALYGIARGAITSKGGRLFTELGTPVIAGGGYTGEGPTGQPPTGDGESWAFVTPSLFGYRSEVFTSSNRAGDLLDTSTNDLYAVAERTWLVGWDPCGVGAVLVTLTPADN